ncbi:hypothetical protein Pmani_025187 [Petrolisthes manimaculis]|uniref:Uncharacterized protein n=1 Tax=Petrolisthes manimaculis TaxID=1843537 RepID=A0AAE1P7S1_9EUCA|nr:hypothetical protein Pmani_025187 [Petrolisthes manimaculis]
MHLHLAFFPSSSPLPISLPYLLSLPPTLPHLLFLYPYLLPLSPLPSMHPPSLISSSATTPLLSPLPYLLSPLSPLPSMHPPSLISSSATTPPSPEQGGRPLKLASHATLKGNPEANRGPSLATSPGTRGRAGQKGKGLGDKWDEATGQMVSESGKWG